ncbi:MAG: hypothetical protein A3H97_03680 [Acidobacteria bacterium RIFCSPLOWO2_02_FULL_65_29]|nr:MAG: hypothetical protein A3H97_03680 [Acidobacteria bacterium RIFCSPLOWO2_02_FULL_65_29]
MATEKHPLLRLRKRNGQFEEVTVGPSAGQLVLGIVVVIVIGVLLLLDVVDWRDLVPLLNLALRSGNSSTGFWHLVRRALVR